jgi:hypothetical protein
MCDNLLNQASCKTKIIGREIAKLYNYIDSEDSRVENSIPTQTSTDISNVPRSFFKLYDIRTGDVDIDFDDLDNISNSTKPYFLTVLGDITTTDLNFNNIDIYLPTITEETLGSHITTMIIKSAEGNIPDFNNCNYKSQITQNIIESGNGSSFVNTIAITTDNPVELHRWYSIKTLNNEFSWLYQ